MAFEEKMKQDLKKDLEIPEIVEQKIQDAYKEIGQGKLRMKKPDNRNQKGKKVWTAAAAAVAAIRRCARPSQSPPCARAAGLRAPGMAQAAQAAGCRRSSSRRLPARPAQSTCPSRTCR